MDLDRLRAHRFRNSLQSLLLAGLLAGLCAWLAWLIGGDLAAVLVVAFVAGMYLANPAASPRLIMALYRARPLVPERNPGIYRLLEALSERAGLDYTPLVYYLPSRVMNAFSTGGRGGAAIAVSDGLLRGLEPRELTGVLAHEVSHIAHDDIRVMGFADLVSRVTGFLSTAGQVLLLINLPLLVLTEYHIPWLPVLFLVAAPSLSALLQLALSRNREYEADRRAAELTGDPEGLASALGKLGRQEGRFWEQILLPGQRVPDPSLLRTHPPTEERVRRLLELRTPRRPSRSLIPGLYGDDADLFDAIRHGQSPHRPRRHFTGLWY